MQTDASLHDCDVSTELALQDSVVNMVQPNTNMGKNLNRSSTRAILPEVRTICCPIAAASAWILVYI